MSESEKGLAKTGTPADYNVRNLYLYIPSVRTVVYGKHSLSFFEPYLWSKLSISNRNETSRKRFKESIKKKDLGGGVGGGGVEGAGGGVN